MPIPWLELLKGIYSKPTMNSYAGYKTSQDGGVVDANGLDVTDDKQLAAYDKAVKSGTQNQLYQSPGFIDSVVNPQLAGSVNSANMQYQSAPYVAQQQHETALGLGASDYSKIRSLLPSQLNNPTVNDQQGYLMTGGDYNPTATGQVATSLQNNLNGVPSLNSAQNILAAKGNLQSTLGSLNRQPVTEATLDQEAVNRLAKETQVDPKLIQMASIRASGELGRAAGEQETLDWMQRNNLYRQESVIPPAQEFEAGQNKFNLGQQSLLNYGTAAQNVGDVYRQTHQPGLTTPFPMQVTPNLNNPSAGTITPTTTVDPTYPGMLAGIHALQQQQATVNPQASALANALGLPQKNPSINVIPSQLGSQAPGIDVSRDLRTEMGPEPVAQPQSTNTQLIPGISSPDAKFGRFGNQPTRGEQIKQRSVIKSAQDRENKIADLKSQLAHANTGRGTFMTKQDYTDRWNELNELLGLNQQ